MDDLLKSLNAVNDPNIPPWASLLIKSMQFLVSEITCVRELAARVSHLENYKTTNDKNIDELLAENIRLKERLDIMEYSLDDQEQRNRNYCLMLHGVEEANDEDTDELVLKTIIDNLSVPIEPHNLQRSHRVGPRRSAPNTRSTTQKPRPIIFRFRDYRFRESVFRNKKKLKNTNVSITENLTKRRMELYKLASLKLGRGNVWTIEGRITTKVNNKTVIIMSAADLDRLGN